MNTDKAIPDTSDYFAQHAALLLDGGWIVVPIPAGTKGPRKSGWQQTTIQSARASLAIDAGRSGQGVGILAGEILAVDIDVLDETHSGQLAEIAQQHLGATPFVRIGRAPKQMLIYRREDANAKKLTQRLRDKQGIEFLAAGQQFVALHIHPDTQRPYIWPQRSPLAARVSDLPLATEAQISAAFAAMREYCKANGLLEEKATQGELALSGSAADAASGMRGAAELSGSNKTRSTPRKRQGGRVAAGGWRGKLNEAMKPGSTDAIGSVAASYVATTPVHKLSEQAFSVAAATAAMSNALDTTAGDRAGKLAIRNSSRNIRSALERFAFAETLAAGKAPTRASADDVFDALKSRLMVVMPSFAEFARQRDAAAACIPKPKRAATINTRQGWAEQEADKLAAVEAGLVIQSESDAKRAQLEALHSHLPDAPLLYATPTMGVGKSGLTVEALAETLAQWSGRRKPRVLFFTERHDLLSQLADKLRAAIDDLISSERSKLEKLSKRRNKELARRRIRSLEWARDNVFHVQSAASSACKDDARRDLHREFVEAPISRTKAICKSCPLAKSCGVFAVNSKSSDEAGVYFLASSHLNHVGKYDGRLAHLVIIDEDPTNTLKNNAKPTAFASTPLESFLSVPPVVAWTADEASDKNAMRIIPIDAWQAATRVAINLPKKSPEAICDAVADWLAQMAGERELLAEQVEAALADGRQKTSADLLPSLRDAVARERFSEALLETIRFDAQLRNEAISQIGRDPGPLVVAPIVWQITKGGSSEIVTEYLRPGLSTLRTTPLIALNGTARLGELLGGLGSLNRSGGDYSLRPAFSFDGHAAPGTGVTHLTVPDTFIPKAMFTENADERSNNFAFESFAALIEALHGQTLVIAPKAHEDSVRGKVALREVIDDLNRAWGRNNKPLPIGIDGAPAKPEPSRLHFGGQRGNDEHGKVSAIVCIGQSLPRNESIELSARARGLAARHLVGGGGLSWQATTIERADGRHVEGVSLRHLDTHCEAERARIVTDECAQAVHRGRAVRRSDLHMVVTIGTEYGACGIPADKFARLTDVRSVSRVDIAAMTGVLPVTAAAFARSVFGRWYGGGMTASADAVKQAVANLEKHGVIPDEQEIIDSSYAAELLFGHWKPGQRMVAAPTWGVFEGRPMAQPVVQANINCIPKVESKGVYAQPEGEETPTQLAKKEESREGMSSGHMRGGFGSSGQLGDASPIAWGQRGPANRWLVKLTGHNAHPDPRVAIEAVSGPMASIKQVATLTAKLSDAAKHALANCGRGVLPSLPLADRAQRSASLAAAALPMTAVAAVNQNKPNIRCAVMSDDTDEALELELLEQAEYARLARETDDDSGDAVSMAFPATQMGLGAPQAGFGWCGSSGATVAVARS